VTSALSSASGNAPGADRAGGLSITFHVAAGTVTGSRFLVEHQGRRVLAGSDMATGGRILHHLESVAPDHRRRLGTAGHAPEAVSSIVHGEPSAADALRRRLRDDLGSNAAVAVDHQTVTVAPSAAGIRS